MVNNDGGILYSSLNGIFASLQKTYSRRDTVVPTFSARPNVLYWLFPRIYLNNFTANIDDEKNIDGFR